MQQQRASGRHNITTTRRTKVIVNTSMPSKNVIGIVGAGGVGSAIASSLIHKNITHKILLHDVNPALCHSVVLDLQDEGFVSGTVVDTSSLAGISKCNVIIITAGAKQKPDEPRSNLIQRNATILTDILEAMFPLDPSTIIIVVSNPVDALTSLAATLCEPYIPKTQVLGSGTYLDSQRLRVALAKKLRISVKSIHAYVLGEHGDSQVVARSAATIGGCTLDQFHPFSQEEFTEIEREVRMKAYEIIKGKGSTFHGIGACVATIAEAILLDKKEIIPVSLYHPTYDTYLGWPGVIGNNGVLSVVPVNLSEDEQTRLALSVGTACLLPTKVTQSSTNTQ